MSDPEILEFIQRIEARIDDEIESGEPAARHAGRIEVQTRSSDRFERCMKERLGSPEKPLTESRLRAKFRGNAGAIMNEPAVGRLEKRLGAIEEREDVSVIAGGCAAARDA